MQSPSYARARPPIDWKKPLLFGVWAALGAVLCALLGELWLAMTVAPAPPPPPPPPAPPPQIVVMVLDTSGSMTGGPFESMKRAALDYIGRQDYKRTQIGIVSFNTDSRIVSGLSRDPVVLRNAINSLSVNGVTRMDLGLSSGLSLTPTASSAGAVNQGAGQPSQAEQRNILLFTDGVPMADDFFTDTPALTRSVANGIRQSGCRLLAIGSGAADTQYLAELTGDPQLVFSVTDNQFGEAFKQAEIVINNPTGHALIQSQKVDNFDAGRELWRIAVWTGLLGLGISGALVLSQSAYARRRPGGKEALGMVAGLLAGVAAGALGQWMFAQAGDAAIVVTLGRVISWASCGALIGLGIAPFIPNLSVPRATGGGALGGWAGAVGFIVISHLESDIEGRLLGAAIVGFAIGLMVVLAEVAFRRAWLHVSYGPKDAFDLNLGAQAVAVGSDRGQCRILAREVAPVAARYLFESERPVLVDQNGVRHSLAMGDKRTYGNVEITLCGDGSPAPIAESPVVLPEVPVGLIAGPLDPVPLAQSPVAQSPVAQSPDVYATRPMQGPAGQWVLRGERDLILPASSPVLVGRTAGNELVIPDAGVSASHAKITIGGSLLTVTDLGSTNGTFINGRRLEPNVAAALQVGDLLVLGKLEFRVIRF